MTSLRLRLELLLKRYGYLPAIALLLAAAGGWLHLVATPGLRAQAAGQRAALAALATTAPASDDRASPPLIRKRHAAFHAQLAEQESLPAIVRVFFSEAGKSSLALRQMEYRLERQPGDEYLVYHVSVPLNGRYSNIYRFAESVLVQVPAAALEEIAFRRDNAGSDSTEASLHFALYLKRGG